jgi:hypothetical protein
MYKPVICDACGQERRRPVRIFRNVCITRLSADFEPTRRGPNASCTIRPVLSVIASTGNVPGSALRGKEPVWSRSNNGDTERAFDHPRTAHARPKGVLSTVATCCPAFRMTALTRSSLPRLFSDREHLRRQVFLCADDLASIDLD